MKKGFTLVELLGVLVLLSILMVVSVPKILDIINDSNRKKFENDVKELMSIAQLHLETGENETLPIFDFTKIDSDDIEVQNDNTISYDGAMPSEGFIYFSTGNTCTNPNENDICIENIDSISDMNTVDIVVKNLVSQDGKWCANKPYNGNLVVESCAEGIIVDDETPDDSE